eukprot:Colp12_sorted_trinity150504_noHs@3285
MVRAPVTALGVDILDIGVELDQLANELVKLGVSVIGDDTNSAGVLSADVHVHIDLEHGNNVTAVGLVSGGNSLGAKKTGLFGRVPVELNRVLRLESTGGKVAENLHNSDSAGTIIVDTRRTRATGKPSNGILVSTENNGGRRLLSALDAGDQAVLAPLVRELGDGDVRAGTSVFNKLVIDPLRGLLASLRGVVAGEEVRETVQSAVEVLNLKTRKEALDKCLVRGGGVVRRREDIKAGCTQILAVGDVHEVNTDELKSVDGATRHPYGRNLGRQLNKTLLISHNGSSRHKAYSAKRQDRKYFHFPLSHRRPQICIFAILELPMYSALI